MTEKGKAARRRTTQAAPWIWIPVVLGGLLTWGCGDMLQVEVPGDVELASLDTPEMTAVLVTGAIADFECAFGNYTFLGGTVVDEIMNGSAASVYNAFDWRGVTPNESVYGTASCTSLGVYVPLSTARFVADDAYRRLEGYTDAEIPDRASLMATAAAYGGYARILFGEGFCRAAFDVGPALSPSQVLGLAEERFTTAIEHAQAAGNTEILHMAYVGRARARLGLGDLSAAASDARQVPEGFRKDATYSEATTRRENKLFTYLHRDRTASVEPSFWDVMWEGVPDPRVSLTSQGICLDKLTPSLAPDQYASIDAPIPIATWEEAQLIIAEAEGGQIAVGIINDLLQRAGLAPTFVASDPAEILDGIIEQRRRQLFLQSHRLGDLLRYGLPFPTGVHPYKGVAYESSTCFPLPTVEILNNPNISG